MIPKRSAERTIASPSWLESASARELNAAGKRGADSEWVSRHW